jgi:hypothetical protein
VSAPSFAQLSRSRQLLVRLCQATNFGSVQDLIVQGGEPIFAASPPIVLQEVKLDSEDHARSEAVLPDFLLCTQFRRLISMLDQIGNGKIFRIEIRAGLPRKIVVERSVWEYLAPRSPEGFGVACREAGRI